MVGLNDNQILEERKIWYSHDMVLFEIVKCMKNKECCLLSDKLHRADKKRLRYYKAWAKDFLLFGFKVLTFDKYLVNVYHSVAYFKDIPKFTFNLKKRSEETQEWNQEESIYGYDFFCDFDGKDDSYYEEAKGFKKILDEYQLPYYVLNSSSRGFHFVIEWKYLPKMELNSLVESIYSLMADIKAIYEYKCLDISIYDIARVKKCPYSYVCDGTIALPLSDKQFENFSVDIVKMRNVLTNVKLFKRGLLVRNLDLSEEQLKKNVLRFFEEHKNEL